MNNAVSHPKIFCINFLAHIPTKTRYLWSEWGTINTGSSHKS